MNTGYLSVIIATLMWGSSTLFVRWAGTDGVATVFFMASFATLAILIYIIASKRYKDFKVNRYSLYLLAMAMASVLNNVFYYMAINRTTIANAAITHYFMPIIVVLIAPVFLNEMFRKKNILAAVIAFAGLAVIVSGTGLSLGSSGMIGNLFGLASAVFFAISMILNKMALKHFGTEFVTFWLMAISALILLPLVLHNFPALTIKQVGAMLYLGIISQAIGVMLYIRGLKMIDASVVSIITYLEVVFAAIFSILILKEPLSAATITGGVLVLAGISVTSIEWGHLFRSSS